MVASQQGQESFSSPERPDRHCGQTSLVFRTYRGSFPGVKRPGREVNHSPQSSAEVKNNWGYNYKLLPIHVHGVDWEHFTFFLPLRMDHSERLSATLFT
jgi:hypothetical protein